jgi:hypothetical protein
MNSLRQVWSASYRKCPHRAGSLLIVIALMQREVLTLSGFALTVALRAAFGLLNKNGTRWTMSETMGRLLAAGQRAEVFEWAPAR